MESQPKETVLLIAEDVLSGTGASGHPMPISVTFC